MFFAQNQGLKNEPLSNEKQRKIIAIKLGLRKVMVSCTLLPKKLNTPSLTKLLSDQQKKFFCLVKIEQDTCFLWFKTSKLELKPNIRIL
jgi:hypothetical protein